MLRRTTSSAIKINQMKSTESLFRESRGDRDRILSYDLLLREATLS
jgi:hypothetical protein